MKTIASMLTFPFKDGKLRKNILRLLLFSALILIDLIAIPHAMSFKETITETVYETSAYAGPQARALEPDALPEEVKSVVTDLLHSFRAKYPSDNITFYSISVGYVFRNDSTTAGYTEKLVPVYAVFIYRTYTRLSLNCFIALSSILFLNILILLIIVNPRGFWEAILREFDESEPEREWFIPYRSESSYR